MRIYTIGYGGRSAGEFLELLTRHDIKTAVDVRLRPDRASMGIWVKAKTPDKGIERLLAQCEIGYRSIVELGNPFVDFDDWEPRYRRLIELAGDLLVKRLDEIPPPYCLLCAEKRSSECHRRMIANYLVESRGFTVEHIE